MTLQPAELAAVDAEDKPAALAASPLQFRPEAANSLGHCLIARLRAELEVLGALGRFPYAFRHILGHFSLTGLTECQINITGDYQPTRCACESDFSKKQS